MTSESLKTAWSTIDQTADPQHFVRVLDAANDPNLDGKEYDSLVDALGVQAGERVLDVGCGTGYIARVMARRVGPSGHVVGVDNSNTMIAEARRRAAGLHLPVEYQVADARRLPFADNSFDICYAIGVLEIADDPATVLREMVRVLAPGGRIMVESFDADSWMFDTTDRDLTRTIVHFFSDHESNGWIGRQLPRLCREAGLVDIGVVPQIRVSTDFPSIYDNWFERTAQHAREAGVVSAQEVARWVADLEERSHAGSFFATLQFFAVAGHKPPPVKD